MEKSATKITVPSVAELPEIIKAFPQGDFPLATDFAIANGLDARGGRYENLDILYSGKIWTRNIISKQPFQVGTYDFLPQEECPEGDFHLLGNTPITAKHIGLMPRFQNPEAKGIGVMELNGRSVLTINDQIVVYPQDYVGVDKMQMLQHHILNSEYQIQVGEYRTLDAFKGKAQKHKCYYFGGQNYVQMEKVTPITDDYAGFANGEACKPNNEYWFACRPINAMRCKDGSIQCLSQILPCYFDSQEKFTAESAKRWQELNTDLFDIGIYMNYELINDLEHSTNFTNIMIAKKLSKVDAGLSQNSLKQNDKNKDEKIMGLDIHY